MSNIEKMQTAIAIYGLVIIYTLYFIRCIKGIMGNAKITAHHIQEQIDSQKEDEKMGIIFIDYAKAKECNNIDAWFNCLKCGQCGRVFKDGFMVDEGGTTPQSLTDEEW